MSERSQRKVSLFGTTSSSLAATTGLAPRGSQSQPVQRGKSFVLTQSKDEARPTFERNLLLPSETEKIRAHYDRSGGMNSLPKIRVELENLGESLSDEAILEVLQSLSWREGYVLTFEQFLFFFNRKKRLFSQQKPVDPIEDIFRNLSDAEAEEAGSPATTSEAIAAAKLRKIVGEFNLALNVDGLVRTNAENEETIGFNDLKQVFMEGFSSSLTSSGTSTSRRGPVFVTDSTSFGTNRRESVDSESWLDELTEDGVRRQVEQRIRRKSLKPQASKLEGTKKLDFADIGHIDGLSLRLGKTRTGATLRSTPSRVMDKKRLALDATTNSLAADDAFEGSTREPQSSSASETPTGRNLKYGPSGDSPSSPGKASVAKGGKVLTLGSPTPAAAKGHSFQLLSVPNVTVMSTANFTSDVPISNVLSTTFSTEGGSPSGSLQLRKDTVLSEEEGEMSYSTPKSETVAVAPPEGGGPIEPVQVPQGKPRPATAGAVSRNMTHFSGQQTGADEGCAVHPVSANFLDRMTADISKKRAASAGLTRPLPHRAVFSAQQHRKSFDSAAEEAYSVERQDRRHQIGNRRPPFDVSMTVLQPRDCFSDPPPPHPNWRDSRPAHATNYSLAEAQRPPFLVERPKSAALSKRSLIREAATAAQGQQSPLPKKRPGTAGASFGQVSLTKAVEVPPIDFSIKENLPRWLRGGEHADKRQISALNRQPVKVYPL
jgi:hypothetical protein